MPHGLDYDAAIIRGYLYDRVFGNADGPAPLSRHNEQSMTKYQGHFISLGALREQILKHLEDLVRYMISPGSRKKGQVSESNTSSDGESITHRLPTDNILQPSLSGESSIVEMADHPQPSQAAGTRRSSLVNQLRSAELNRSQSQGTVTKETTSPVPQTHTRIAHHNVESESIYQIPTPTDEGFYSENGLGQTSPPIPCENFPQGAQFGAFPQSAYSGGYPTPIMVTPGFQGPVSPGQMPPSQQPWAFQQPSVIGSQGIYQWPQTYPMAGYSGWGPQSVSNNTNYVLPPLHYPQSFARPPASTRVAPLFAQTTAWQSPQSARVRQTPGAILQNPEWQNRFGPQPVVAPDLPLLPYRSGSDEMYPRQTGGASIRFQNLTRNGPLSFRTASADENVPFVETARSTKPAEWGVMKIGNVSKKGGILGLC